MILNLKHFSRCARPLLKQSIRKMSYVLLYRKNSALRARPSSSDGKMRGTIWRKMPIFKKENWVWYAILYENFPRCARGLYHFIEKCVGGTIWRKLPTFKEDNWVWLAILCTHFQRCARGLFHLMEKWGRRFAEKCRPSEEHWVWFAILHKMFRTARAAFYHFTEIWGGGTIWRKLAKLVGNVLQILANIGKLSLVVFSFDKHGYLLCIEAILTKM